MLDDQINDTTPATEAPDGAAAAPPSGAPESPAPDSAAPDSPAPDGPAPAKAARAPRKRAPRKSAAAAAAATSEAGTSATDATPGEQPDASAAATSPEPPADVPAHHPPAKKATRSRRSPAKKAASSSEPGAAAEPNAEGIAPAQAVTAPGLSALPAADQPAADQPAADPASTDPASTDDGGAAASTTPLFQPPAASAPAKRAPRKRTAKKTAAAATDAPEAADPAAVAAAPTEPLPLDLPAEASVADQAPGAPADQTEADADADADAAELGTDQPVDPEDAAAEDDEAQDTDETALAAVDAEPDDPSESVPDDTDETEREGGPRRRRRRGGRRRRKGGDSGDASTDEGDTPSGDDGEDDRDVATATSGDADVSVTPGAGPKDKDRDDKDDDASEGGSSRRRRRRRRSGDGDDNTGDDPANTVTKVRKSRSAEDEITGFTGSTRLEAKKQRRREGREAGRRRAPLISEAEFLARRESVDRTMVIRQRHDLTQIAVLEDKVLVEHYVARESQTSLMGNVYLGRVQNVLPSMEAAFIDIGKGRNAVLYAGEVNWDSFGVKDGQRKIEQVLKSGQTILVQVSKDPVGHKGARLTSQVSLPGRFLVYVPDGTTSGISRKLPENERTRLKTLLKEVVPDGAGVIVRTAAEGASEEELTRDVERLKARWEDISAKIASGSAPQLLYGEPDLTLKVVRDLFTEDFSKLVISGDDAWDLVEGYVSQVAPDLMARMEKHDDSGGDAFVDLRIDEQIAKALDRKVYLPSGGSLVIDRTEAMTVVDVNTGKFTGSGGNLEETVTKNNLEAAEEIVRQLRLRDIGGIIVVDFIDMVLESNRDLVLRRLVECLGRDRTRHQVAEVTSLGLVQMTRKRIGTGLLEAFSETCEACQGRGLHVQLEPVEDKRRTAEDEPQRSGRGDRGDRGGRSGRRGRADDRADDRGGDRGGDDGASRGAAEVAPTPPKRPTPAEFAAMARAEAARVVGVEPEPAEEQQAEVADAGLGGVQDVDAGSSGDQVVTPEEQPAGVQPVEQPAEVQPVEQPASVPAAPRIVTTVRRRGARRPAGPPATATADLALSDTAPDAAPATAGGGAVVDAAPDGTVPAGIDPLVDGSADGAVPAGDTAGDTDRDTDRDTATTSGSDADSTRVDVPAGS